MGSSGVPALPGAQSDEERDRAPAPIARRVLHLLRPSMGWLPLACLSLLNVLAAYSVVHAGWVHQQGSARTLLLMAALAPASLWLVAGKGRVRRPLPQNTVAGLASAALSLLAGLLLLSLLTVRWLPPPAVWLESLQSRDWLPVQHSIQSTVESFVARASLWSVGLRLGGGLGDELFFTILAGAFFWLTGLGGAALLRHSKQGLLGALPALSAIGFVVFLGGQGRLLFVAALAVALAQHVAADLQRLQHEWERDGLDYAAGLTLEVWISAAGLAAVALAAALLAPSFSVRSIADFFARLVAPVDARLEEARQIAFPNVTLRPRFSLAGAETGLPNAFLLGSGPELADTPVLTVRTSDVATTVDKPPEAPYLRALLLDIYTGRGWEVAPVADHSEVVAGVNLPISTAGRRLVAQSVRQHQAASTWFVAGEALQFGAAAWVSRDAQGQFITAQRSPTSFTALSAVPALGEESLAMLPPWGPDNPLPPGFENYLALPESVTDRTRTLAQELTAGISSPFLQAAALEAWLRTIPYDLEAPAPPADVADVTDWFLFELQRGYCDYYATAFVVLARSLGLPARFVIGYAPGEWQPFEQAWRVSAADSHAWAELYLPEVGWLPFEPTAGLPPMTRSGRALPPKPASAPPAAPPPPPALEPWWNWQQLTWLLPAALLVASLWRLLLWRRARRDEPWHALQRWGARVFRPRSAGETPLEYGRALAAAAEALADGTTSVEEGLRSAAHRAANEARSLTAAVSAFHYAQPDSRPDAQALTRAHWRDLRPLLPRLTRRLRRRRSGPSGPLRPPVLN